MAYGQFHIIQTSCYYRTEKKHPEVKEEGTALVTLEGAFLASRSVGQSHMNCLPFLFLSTSSLSRSDCCLLSQVNHHWASSMEWRFKGSGVSQHSMGDATGIRRFWFLLGPSSLHCGFLRAAVAPREIRGFRTTVLIADSWSPWQPLSSQHCNLHRGCRQCWGATNLSCLCPQCRGVVRPNDSDWDLSQLSFNWDHTPGLRA